MKFKVNDKVLIKGHWNFPSDCTGKISDPPETAVMLSEDHEPWDGIHRITKGVKGPIEFYWVVFDKPQMDSDGDGPYGEGEIEKEYIKLIEG